MAATQFLQVARGSIAVDAKDKPEIDGEGTRKTWWDPEGQMISNELGTEAKGFADCGSDSTKSVEDNLIMWCRPMR